MGLHVGVVGAKQLLGALDGDVFGDIDKLAAAIIAPARIAFGVLIGQHAAQCRQHGRRHVIFAGNQLDAFRLAPPFQLDRLKYLGVALGQQPAWIGHVRPGGQLFVQLQGQKQCS